MSPGASSYAEGDRNRGGSSRGDGEKASKPSTYESRDGGVNSSTRLPGGASSRSSRFDGPGDTMARSSHRGPPPRSPRNSRRSRSPYRAPNSKRRSISRSPSRSRSRSYSPSPPRRGLNARLRSQSPPGQDGVRAGDKRPRSSNHYSTSGHSDPRRFKVHYEKEKDAANRGLGHSSRGRTNGPDRGDTGRHFQRSKDDGRLPRESHDLPTRNDRDRGDTRRRSRSPYRRGQEDTVRSQQQIQPDKASQQTSSNDLSSSRSAHIQNNEDTHRKNQPAQGSQQARVETEETTKEAEPESTPQLTEDELIEQRRKRREAIKAKYKNQQPPLLVQALEQNTTSTPNTPQHESSGLTSERASSPNSLESPRTPASPGSPASINVSNDEELANRQQADATPNDDEGPSAADYDPTMDMQEDRPDHKPFVNAAQSQPVTANPPTSAAAEEPDKEFDMFAEDDDDDMFAPAGTTMKTTGHAQVRALDSRLLDNWDYPDGHYRIILGELLDGRYAVQQQIGKGTFATVVRATDTKTNQDVAVKIACNNETMYKAGTKEMDMLTLLNASDPEDKKHVIRLLRNFDHKNHMCLVFENLHSDLREVLKKFGRNVGINLKAIRAYARQMFLALSHLKKSEVLHADLKPDNILVNQERSHLKICDLGTASKAEDAEVTPYLVSRFYRAPEVILGMPLDYGIDMWSIGCTLFELYTGRILFAGGDNNQMLRVIQECRGKFPKRVIIRSTLADKHFIGGDPEYVFVSQERDKITGNTTMKQLNFAKTVPGKDLKARLTGNAKSMAPAELKELHAFVDLLEKCLQLDPTRRISPNDALRHPFIQHTQPATAAATTTKVKPAMAPLRMR
ncbi:hypothetical protein Q7P37_010183 [Cladosporium fusiforme]